MPLSTAPITMVPIARINIPPKRIRKVYQESVRQFLSSIQRIGLLQPIVLTPEAAVFIQHTDVPAPQQWRLVAGEHRLKAFALHYATAHDDPLTFCNKRIPVGSIPSISVLDAPEMLFEMELAENLFRIELTWQEKTQALAQLHGAAVALDPDTSILNTAQKLSDATGGKPETIRKNVAASCILADHLDDPEIGSAKTRRQAWNLLKKKVDGEARRSVRGNTLSPHTFLPGDCRELLPTLPADSFDLILSDPPYGIEANKWKQGIQDHAYDDTLANALEIYTAIVTEGFRVAKPEANMFLFHSVTHFPLLADIATTAGWTVWPRPIIWVKGNEGMRPWGQMGFAYTYEGILFATKGSKGLVQTSIDVLQFAKPRGERVHAAQKPVDLLVELLRLGCSPGAQVLDPCAGSGSIFHAGTAFHVSVTGMEKDPIFIGECQAAMQVMEDADTPVTTASDDLGDLL